MISGIVLAAGGSSRLGRPKQLLPLGGEPLLSHVLRAAAASRLDDIVLVLGYEADTIAAAVGDWGQRIVVNARFAEGMSTSLHAGLAAIDPGTEAALFLIGDQPGVTSEMIDALIERYRSRAALIVQPRYGDTPGNPVLIDQSLFAELAKVTGDEGGRQVIRNHPGDVELVAVLGGVPPADVDTEEAYQALIDAWTTGDGPPARYPAVK